MGFAGASPYRVNIALRRPETPVGRGSCRAVINPWRERFIVKGTMAAPYVSEFARTPACWFDQYKD